MGKGGAWVDGVVSSVGMTAVVILCIMLLYAFVRLERQTTGSGKDVQKTNLLLGWRATDEHSPCPTQRSMA